jgi:hypothetical protein
MNIIYINLVIEDDAHLNLLTKIIQRTNFKLHIQNVFGRKGNDYILQKLKAFNHAAAFTPYLILTDLDNRHCPKTMRDEWIDFRSHPNFMFRIAVREAEAWLIADRKNLAGFFGISEAKIQRNPESILNPKEYLIELAKLSKKRDIKQDIIPIGSAKIGPNYNAALANFIFNHWNMDEAEKHSESLRRLLQRLREFKPVP